MKRIFLVFLILAIILSTAPLATAAEYCPDGAHEWIELATIDPTCEEYGYTEYICANCQAYKLDDYTEPLGHLGDCYADNGDGTHSETCPDCGIVLDSDKIEHDYVDGFCHCGAIQPEYANAFRISSVGLKLRGNIDLIYTATVPSGFSDVYMEFFCNGESYTATDCTAIGETYYFTFTGITPQCIGDTIAATLHGVFNGTDYTNSIDYSARQYCVDQLANESITAELRALLSDLLAYGAAAQTYTGYKTDSLATSGNDIINPTYSTFTPLSGTGAALSGLSEEDLYWISGTLSLTNSIAMIFRFYAESVDGLTVKVTINGRTQTFTQFTAVEGRANVYEVSFAGISAEEFGDTATASFERNNVPVSHTASYSVNAYIQSKQNSDDTNLKALVKALYNYGAAAKIYSLN